MWILRRGLCFNADGAPAGGSVTPGSATTPPASSTPPPASVGAPAAFDWKTAGLDETALALVNERQWKGPGDVLQSYRNLEKLTGVPPERIVKIPGPKDDPNAWNEVFAKLGRPETADKYVIPVPEGDKGEFAGVAKNWFHEAGVTQSQATKLAEKWNAFQAEQQKAHQTQIEQRNATQITELKKAWGSEYETRENLVQKAAETFGMDQKVLDALKQTMGPKGAMEFLYTIGSKLGVEDAKVAGLDTKGGQNFGMTPEAAAAKLKQLKADPTFAKLFNSADPKQRMDARAEIDRLSKLAYPGVTPVANVSGGQARA